MQKLNESPDEIWICTFGTKIYAIQDPSGEPIELTNAAEAVEINTPLYTVKSLWDLICQQAWRNGEPGLIFIDEMQRKNGKEIQCVNPCQPGDALLLDGDRLRKISEGGETWTSWKTSTSKEVLLLQCNNGLQIRCTPEHKIMLDDDTFIEAKDVLGKSIKWSTAQRQMTATAWHKVYQLRDEEVVRGFLFGDGFKCGNGHGIAVKLDITKEPEIATLLQCFGFHRQPSESFYINRAELEAQLDLNMAFLDKRVYDREIPEDILYGCTSKVASFLRGLFSANGSCNRSGQISLKSTCLSAVRDIQVLLASFGVPSWISTNPPASIQWSNGTYISRESYSLQIAPRNTYLFFTRVIGSFLQEAKNNNFKFSDRPYCTKLLVDSISSLGKQEVWDYRMHQPPHYNFCQGVMLSNCGELPLEPYGACCLGSIDVSKFHLRETELDWTRLEDVIFTAVDLLNATIDKGSYPLLEIEQQVKAHRRIGLGIMGFADLLLKMHIRYGSDESIEVAERLMSFVTYRARAHSENKGYNNTSVTVLAPTGSISILADTSAGIEPNFGWVVKHHREDFGDYEVVHPLAEPYIKSNQPLPDYFVTASQVSPEEHVKVQAAFQKHTESAVSKTVNLPGSATVEDIEAIYRMAFNMECKGITVYRDGSRAGQVLTDVSSIPESESLVSTDEDTDDEHEDDTIDKLSDFPEERPYCLESFTFKVPLDMGGKVENVYTTVGCYKMQPYEVFVNGNIREAETHVAQHIDTTTRLTSLALRYNVPLERVIEQLQKIPSCHIYSIPHKMAQILKEFLPPPDEYPPCPECGSTKDRIFSEGCEKCQCGWAKCS